MLWTFLAIFEVKLIYLFDCSGGYSLVIVAIIVTRIIPTINIIILIIFLSLFPWEFRSPGGDSLIFRQIVLFKF